MMGASIPIALSIWKSSPDINFIFAGLNNQKTCNFCKRGYNRKGLEHIQH